MAHYAFLDENNVVVQVIVGRDEDEVVDGISDWEEYYGNLMGMRCVRTSYNSNIRYNFAALGGTYDEENDAFIPPKPYPSWVLSPNFKWVAPVEPPVEMFMDLANNEYDWSEDEQKWVHVPVDGYVDGSVDSGEPIE